MRQSTAIFFIADTLSKLMNLYRAVVHDVVKRSHHRNQHHTSRALKVHGIASAGEAEAEDGEGNSLNEGLPHPAEEEEAAAPETPRKQKQAFFKITYRIFENQAQKTVKHFGPSIHHSQQDA